MTPELQAQTPAQGVLQIKDWGQSQMYRAVCECGDTDCDHVIDVEADDHSVTVTIYTRTRTNFWSRTRWSHLWRLLTQGYTDYETTIMLQEQSALNYAETLKKAVQDVRNFKKPPA